MTDTHRVLSLIDEIHNTLIWMKTSGCRGFEKRPPCATNSADTDETPETLPLSRPPLLNSPDDTPAMSLYPQDSIDAIQRDIANCQRCKLAKTRTNIVLGDGAPSAQLMFIGEAPGFDEDQQGKPFVGRAGQLLTRIIQAMGLTRDQVYIGNVIKCRPPGNRNPEPDEISACAPFLNRQIAVIQPEFICALGTFAAQTLLHTTTPISKLRGQFHDHDGIQLMPTFHPSYLLRNPEKKREVWEDIKLLMNAMGLEWPPLSK